MDWMEKTANVTTDLVALQETSPLEPTALREWQVVVSE